MEVLGAFLLASVMYLGVSRIGDEAMTVGTFVSFFTVLGLMFSPLKKITKVNDPIQRAIAACNSVFTFIDNKTEDIPTKNTTSFTIHSIYFANICAQYEIGWKF